MQTPSTWTAASRDELWNKRRALLADHHVYLSPLYLEKKTQITSDVVAFKLLVSSEGESDVDVTRGLIRTVFWGGVSRSARPETVFKPSGREPVARVTARGRGGGVSMIYKWVGTDGAWRDG